MAFTARLLKAEKRDSGWKIRVEFTDGTDVRVRDYRFNGTTTKDLVTFVRSEANKTANVKISDYSALVGQSIDVTPPEPIPEPEPEPVIPPTAEEIAHANWLRDWAKLKEIQRLFAAIPNLATTQGLQYETDLKTTLESGWLNSYLGSVR